MKKVKKTKKPKKTRKKQRKPAYEKENKTEEIRPKNDEETKVLRRDVRGGKAALPEGMRDRAGQARGRPQPLF